MLHLFDFLFVLLTLRPPRTLLDKSSCFGLPYWSPFSILNKCPVDQRQVGDPNNPRFGFPADGGYWGCTYNADVDKATQNLETPLIKDSFQLWQRSWAVIRFEATRPVRVWGG